MRKVYNMAQNSANQDRDGYDETQPFFYIGQHDSARSETLTDLQYGQVLNAGVSEIITPYNYAH